MNALNRILLMAAAILALASCKKDDDAVIPPATPAAGTESLHLVASGTTDGYAVELYSTRTALQVGYNPMCLRLKDAAGGYISGAAPGWEPMMTMTMGGTEHTHGCPWSAPMPTAGNASLYEGYIVFSMAGGAMGHWDLTVRFEAGGTVHDVEIPLEVSASDSEFHKVYTSSVGTDGISYLLAMIEPGTPDAGVNDMVVGLFKRASDTEFPVVDGYTIRVDPRMPGMGNHGAPGSEDLVQGSDGFYHGKAGFSMTGYWKINLLLENASGEVLCGDVVTGTVTGSSVHFKVNF